MPNVRSGRSTRDGAGEICVKPPDAAEDLVVTAQSDATAFWHMGKLGWTEAVRRGVIALAGPPQLAREFPTWNRLSRFAGVAAARP